MFGKSKDDSEQLPVQPPSQQPQRPVATKPAQPATADQVMFRSSPAMPVIPIRSNEQASIKRRPCSL